MMHPIDRSRAVDRFERIARLALGHFPTPIEKMPRLRAAIGGGPALYIKRDDYTGPGLGGNKVRKLEYVLAQAQRSGADCVVTCGGEKSNHCRATAMLAARLGLGCHLVLNPPAVSKGKPASLAVDEWVGAEITRVASGAERAEAMQRVAERLRAQGRNPEVIPVGASTPVGAFGYVAAASELAAEMDARELQFDAIFVCSSSGGTQAGLAAGLQIFHHRPVRLVGISPDDSSGCIKGVVGGILEGIASHLSIGLNADVEVSDEYVGDGYGLPSPAGQEAFDLLARTEGILLDPVYTAKAMAGMLDWIRKGHLQDARRVLFWHTGGQMALFQAD